jgi:hypothetical protein
MISRLWHSRERRGFAVAHGRHQQNKLPAEKLRAALKTQVLVFVNKVHAKSRLLIRKRIIVSLFLTEMNC